MKQRIQNLIPKGKKQRLIVAGVVVLVLVGAAAYVVSKDDAAPESASAPVVTRSTDQPDESLDNAKKYKWQGAPDEPKRIVIKSLGVDALVQQSGVDQNKNMAVPNNIHLAGWFVDSSKPGQKGLSIVAGHVSGPTTDGVFKRLGELKNGDTFSVELGNGDVKNYKVIQTKTVKESEAAGVLYSQNPKTASQVNLITCTGNFDSAKNQFEDRVIVYGALQS